ncbi:MAG: hypothetical protein U0414_09715 [Polyangiaceae bacterium]
MQREDARRDLEVTPAPLSVEPAPPSAVGATSERTPSKPGSSRWIPAVTVVGTVALIVTSLTDVGRSATDRLRDSLPKLGVRDAVAAPAVREESPETSETTMEESALANPDRIDALLDETPDPDVAVDARAPGAAPDAPRTPIAFDRTGHVSVPNGYLVFPSTFETYDGGYDVLIHFHGNPLVVAESAEVAKLNAVVVMINGAGRGGYEEVYGSRPGLYEELLAAIDRGLASRGIEHPHVRRIALTSWSAGYGAISTILSTRKGKDPLDAIALFDGIHASWEGGNSRSFATNGVVQDSSQLTPKLLEARGKATINKLQMRSFLEAAKEATHGELYFGIAHTEIDPMAYASCTIATDFLLRELGLERHPLDPIDDAPHWFTLKAMEGIWDPDKVHQLVPLTEVHEGDLHVIGYSGATPEHHAAHLFEMSQTLLPDIAARWSKPPAREAD